MILDAKITIYSSAKDNIGRAATFADFLRLCIASKDTIKRLRLAPEDERKRLKTTLHGAALSGLFSPTRSIKNLTQHSGLICLDFDNVNDCTGAMSTLANMDIVAYCSRSASGHGVFAVVPLAYPNKHREQFEALRRLFADMGFELDTQCKDVTRLRFVSYDEDASLRVDAVPYRGVYEEPRPAYTPTRIRFDEGDRTLNAVAECVRQIVAGHIDITNDYGDWVNIGMSLASLGEVGRDFFHAVSSQCPAKYDKVKCDKKFTNFLTGTRKSIGSFFYACEMADIKYKKR